MRTELPTGTVTFLFTDIEGSTRLLHALGPDAYAEALAEHRRVLRDAFAAHGGVEVDTQGDAFFVAFPTAPGAIAAAEAGQAALAHGPIRVRMGLHTGTPTVTGEGYVGVDVHRGARVAALAHGGQVVVSPTTAALVDPAPLGDLGLHRLKDFESATRLHQLGPGDFPPLRTPGSVELPTPATRFLGREQELFDAVSLVFEQDPRVLTVLGPGGTGKTRFALELARLLAEDADGGTLFVPLAPVREPSLVLPTLAEALGADTAELQQIAARVGDRRTHVVVDNVEQLLPDAAGALAAITAVAPSLRLIVTSREAVRIGAETQFDLPPLAEAESIELFLARARAVRPDLEGTLAVGELCARLDHLPLAIELAAARTKLLSPEVLLEKLGARLDLPAQRDADPRHATLRTTIDWSYELLDEREKRLFERLSVFAGGCTLESAEDVCDADLDGLASLLDKSLVRRRTDPHGVDRYWMLETIREYAAGRLAELPGHADHLRRHAERMLEIARAAHLSVEDIGRETQDFETRPRRTGGRPKRSRLGDGARSCPRHGDSRRPRLLLDRLSSGGSSTEDRECSSRQPRCHLACELGCSGSTAESCILYRRGRAQERCATARHSPSSGGSETSSTSWVFSRDSRSMQGQGVMRRRHIDSWPNAEAERDRPEPSGRVADALDAGAAGAPQGDAESALALTRRAVRAARESNFQLWTLWELSSQLEFELELGLLDDAERTGREGLELAQRLDDPRMTRWLLTGLALAALRRGDRGTSWTVVGVVVSGPRGGERDAVERVPRHTALCFVDCATARFREAFDSGRLLPLRQAGALALGDSQTEP